MKKAKDNKVSKNPESESTESTSCVCGSKLATMIRKAEPQNYSGVRPATGEAYTTIHRSYMRCDACGQCRIDMSYE